MITEEEIKNVFRECGFHVTPTNLSNRTSEFDPYTGDLVGVEKYRIGSDWYNMKIGKLTDEERIKKCSSSTVIESMLRVFNDLEHLRYLLTSENIDEMVENRESPITGDLFSYLTHFKDDTIGKYVMHCVIFNACGYFYEQPWWASPDKHKVDIIRSEKYYNLISSKNDQGYKLLDTRYTGISAAKNAD